MIEKKIILPYQDFQKRNIIFPEGNATAEDLYSELRDNACTFEWIKERSGHVARNIKIYGKFFGKVFPKTELLITGIHSVGGNAILYSASLPPIACAARKHPGVKREQIQRDFNSIEWDEFSEMYKVRFSETLYLAKCLLINKKPAMAPVEHELRFLREGKVMMEIDDPYIPKVIYADKNVIGIKRILFTIPIESLKPTDRTLEERLIIGENAVGIFANVNKRRREEGKPVLHHRDINGRNILVMRPSINDLAAYAVDFGLVTDPEPLPVFDNENQFATGGILIGTPAYIPPEVVGSGELTDYVNDVYSLGVILYALMTGSMPFRGNTYNTVMKNINTWNNGKGPIPPHDLDPRIPISLSSLIIKALSRDPRERYSDVEVFYDSIKKVRGAVTFPKTERIGVMSSDSMIGTPTLVIAEHERVSHELKGKRKRAKDDIKRDLKKDMGVDGLPSRTMVIGGGGDELREEKYDNGNNEDEE